LRGLGLAGALLLASPATAQTVINVSDAASLVTAITTVDSNPGTSYTINVTANIALSGATALPIVNSTSSVTINGNGHTLDGGNATHGFFVYSGTVSISSMTIQNTVAQGGAGGSSTYNSGGGGGGLGAGGAVFVNSGASVTLSGVSFSGNNATGGGGGSSSAGSGNLIGGGAGGGGLLGNGGAGGNTGGGGGGGLAGNGGAGGEGSGGGGGGLAGSGGSVANNSGTGFGGAGGGGQSGAGANGNSSGNGGGGGTPNGGAGASFANGGTGGTGGGGGGGGASFSGNGGSGGNGGTFGGGGGGAFGVVAGSGGNGGIGGGGGGGGFGNAGSPGATGGTGGDFGGGGGGGAQGNGAVGGFGAGGGGGGSQAGVGNPLGAGGAGGFGGGPGGAGGVDTAGTLSPGGGGGGGSAYGGAVFVRQGGTLVIEDSSFAASNTVTAGLGGTGTTNGAAGSAAGGALYLMSGVTATYSVSSGTQSVASDIAGSGGLGKTGVGVLALSAANTYSGGTTATGGLINFSAANNFGTGTVTLNGGGLQWASGTATDISGRLTAIGSAGATFDTNGNTVTFASALSGTGGVTLADSNATPGMLTLSGANSYTGGTTINAGTLTLAPGASLSASGALAINGGTFNMNGSSQMVGALAGTGGAIALGSGTLTINQSANTSYAGTLSGSGSLIKAGSGTLILDSVNTYTGGTTVSGGALEIGDINNPGASVAGDVTVASGGTLAGHGTVEGDVANIAGGTVSPGGTIGTLSIGGNYTQGSSSTLHIEISPTAASKLEVSGSASLAGTLQLVYDPGVYSKASYDILHAGSISGTFATVSGTAPSGLNQTVSYTSTDVDLALDPSGSVGAAPSVVVAPTNDAIVGALGTAALLNAQQATTTLFGHLADLHSGTGSETIHTALAAATPTQLAFSGNAQSLNGVLTGLPDAMSQMGGWFRGIGDFASLSGNNGVPGFDTRSGGFLAGIDRALDAHVIAGAALGYSHTDIGESGNSGSLDTPRLLLYGSYGSGPWAFDATIGYAYDSISATRPIATLGETASSSHDGQEATGALQATRRFVVDGVSLLPAAGLQYAHLFEGGYSENGAAGFDLAVSSRNADSLRPFVGASAAKAFTTDHMVLIPEADLTYSHEMFNTPPSLVSVGGGGFIVDGLVPSRDQVTLGCGVSAKMSERFAVYADYHAVLPSGNLFEQTVSAGLSYRF